MGDFLSRVTQRPSETVEVAGEQIEVRGLSIGEMNRLRHKHKDDEDALGVAVLCASCFLDGKPVFTEQTIQDVMPEFLSPIGEAISRLNGNKSGNSKATGSDGSSSV